MTPKKKAPTARDGGALDDVRPCKAEPILSAACRRKPQEPTSFGTGLSTGPQEGPFSCPDNRGATHFCTQHDDGSGPSQATGTSGETGSPERHFDDAPLYVDSLSPSPRRTASPQGQTLPELQRLRLAATFLSKRGWRLAFVTLAAHHLPAEDFRAALRTFKSRVTDCQRRGGMKPGMYVEVLETKVSTHSHLIVAGTPKVLKAIRRLAESETFAKLDDPETSTTFVKVQTVYDLDHLADRYLAKEATAWAAEKTGKRYQRHASKAIGDRVRLGRGLEAAMLASGDLRPYRKTYSTPTAAKVAKRSKPKAVSADALEAMRSHSDRNALAMHLHSVRIAGSASVISTKPSPTAFRLKAALPRAPAPGTFRRNASIDRRHRSVPVSRLASGRARVPGRHPPHRPTGLLRERGWAVRTSAHACRRALRGDVCRMLRRRPELQPSPAGHMLVSWRRRLPRPALRDRVVLRPSCLGGGTPLTGPLIPEGCQ